jgi:hypothetical protein
MAAHSISTVPSWSALRRKERRRHRRYQVANSVLRASWLDANGNLKMAQGVRVLNVSEGGMALEMPERPLPTSMVRFESEKFKLRGAGAVRHSQKMSTGWMVGIEFANGLRWCAPEGDVEEPIMLCDIA